MSMRATFTTNFIYDGTDGHEDRQKQMEEILLADYPIPFKPRNMVGQIAGITKGLDLTQSDIKRWIDEQCYELSKITIVPFKIVWLFEGGDILIREINARN